MATFVCKFGGSSVADADMFKRVRRIIEANPARRYIVLSAPGKRFENDEKITDLFYRAHLAAREGDYSILSQIRARYALIQDALNIDFPLKEEFDMIASQLKRSADYAASRGEYLCARLFSSYMHLPFVDADQLLFLNSDGHVDIDRSRRAVETNLLPLERAIMPGFYAMGTNGEIQTFSRGGSDVSGAWLCALMKADLYENWTDVDGLYTADPSIVKDARRNHLVSLAQMEAIARAGAQLLHPDALSPLKGSDIDTVLKNTFHPNVIGTRVSEKCDTPVQCVTGKRNWKHKNPALSNTAMINIFGLSEAQRARVAQELTPIHMIHMRDHIKIIVPTHEYEEDIRRVHAILSEILNPDSA